MMKKELHYKSSYLYNLSVYFSTFVSPEMSLHCGGTIMEKSAAKNVCAMCTFQIGMIKQWQII